MKTPLQELMEYMEQNQYFIGNDLLAKYNELIEKEKPKYRLVRERDGLTKQSADVIWLEFNEDGTFKQKHDKPTIGLSLLMSPFNDFFTWQTTDITEIVEQRKDYIKFKTKNSNYELFKL
jgi:hypothetical protein